MRTWTAALIALVAALAAWMPARAVAQPAPVQPGAGAPSGVAAGNQAENIAVIVIRGPIDGFTARSVLRRIEAAEKAGADAIVFEIDTPGGELKAALEICNAIKASSVPLTVAWIRPDAYSAGAIIALSCRRILTSDPATMGDALPILGGPMGTFQGFNSLPEHERQKVMSPLVAEVVNSARRNGYDEMLVQAIVSRGVELWLVRDARTGRLLCITEAEFRLLFDGDPPRSSVRLPSAEAGEFGLPTDAGGPVGPEPARPPPVLSEEDFFQPAGEALAGIADRVNDELTERTARPVLTAGDRGRYELVMYVTNGAGPIVMKAEDMRVLGIANATIRSDADLSAYFGAANMARLDESWSERLARFMVAWPVRFVLIVVFIVAIFVEMTHPGASVPGLIAVLALSALIAPSMIVGMASWWEVAAILAGILMLALELFVVPGFGVFGFAGIVLLFGGLLGVIIPSGDRLFPGESGSGGSAFYAAAMLLAAVVTSGVGIYFITKHLGSLPIINRLVLQDEPGAGGGLLAAMAPTSSPLVGKTGAALTDLRPAGRAEIDGQMVDVVADLGYIAAGTRVRVVSATPMRVGVEAEPPARA